MTIVSDTIASLLPFMFCTTSATLMVAVKVIVLADNWALSPTFTTVPKLLLTVDPEKLRSVK